MVADNPNFESLLFHLFDLYDMDLSKNKDINGIAVRNILEKNLGADFNTLSMYLKVSHENQVANILFRLNFEGKTYDSIILLDFFYKIKDKDVLEMMIVNSTRNVTYYE